MFSEQRWDRLIMEFREENFRIYQLSAVSVFNTVLQDGLAALKTQYGGQGGHAYSGGAVIRGGLWRWGGHSGVVEGMIGWGTG